MAAVQTLHNMTLGNRQPNPKMYTLIQQHSPHQQNNCVIVTTSNQQQILNSTQNVKSVIQQNKRPLAPAPERSSVVVNNSVQNNADMLRCKRKINFAHHMPYSGPGHQPASVARRNARERNRVKQVNNGFATLRQHIPSAVAAALSSSSPASSSGGGRGASKKLSKVETLRMAVEYIRSLQQMIEDYETETGSSTSPSLITNSEMAMLENQYYTMSPESGMNQQHMGHPILIPQQTPPCSEASASPTPSYSSEGSISTPSSTYAPLVTYKSENYDNYEPMSPEDEELLDVITWWQQQ